VLVALQVLALFLSFTTVLMLVMAPIFKHVWKGTINDSDMIDEDVARYRRRVLCKLDSWAGSESTGPTTMNSAIHAKKRSSADTQQSILTTNSTSTASRIGQPYQKKKHSAAARSKSRDSTTSRSAGDGARSASSLGFDSDTEVGTADRHGGSDEAASSAARLRNLSCVDTGVLSPRSQRKLFEVVETAEECNGVGDAVGSNHYDRDDDARQTPDGVHGNGSGRIAPAPSNAAPPRKLMLQDDEAPSRAISFSSLV